MFQGGRSGCLRNNLSNIIRYRMLYYTFVYIEIKIVRYTKNINYGHRASKQLFEKYFESKNLNVSDPPRYRYTRLNFLVTINEIKFYFFRIGCDTVAGSFHRLKCTS